MEVGPSGARYNWVDAWAKFDATPETRRAWPHHGIVAATDDLIVSFHPTSPLLLFFDSSGRVRRSVPVEVTEAHGISVSTYGGQERLLLADAAMKKDPDSGYAGPADDDAAAVIEVDLDGRVVRRLPRPPAALYRDGLYRPTCAVAFDDRLGGNGDIWVADGYGSDMVHRYSASGEYLATLDGTEGAGRFSIPHALLIDTRHGEPELYVADRANGRLQVVDMEGKYHRSIGESFMSRPTSMATHQGWLFIVEFRPPRLCVLDEDDVLVGFIGENEAATAREQWPNEIDAAGELIRPTSLSAGRFNSPHAVAVDRAGNIYVSEWLIGGRTIKLEPLERGGAG